eukprot:gene1937-5026_t
MTSSVPSVAPVIIRDKLRPEEKRRRNKAAAERYRAKKRKEHQELRKLVDVLREQVTVMQDRLRQLENENGILKSNLQAAAQLLPIMPAPFQMTAQVPSQHSNNEPVHQFFTPQQRQSIQQHFQVPSQKQLVTPSSDQQSNHQTTSNGINKQLAKADDKANTESLRINYPIASNIAFLPQHMSPLSQRSKNTQIPATPSLFSMDSSIGSVGLTTQPSRTDMSQGISQAQLEAYQLSLQNQQQSHRQ